MARVDAAELDVVSVQEIARAAEVPVGDVRAVLESGEVPSAGSRFVALDAAASLVRSLRAAAAGDPAYRRLFSPDPRPWRRGRLPIVASGALHSGLIGVILLVTGMPGGSAPTAPKAVEPVRLVFLVAPGPGGGGGGGGLRQPAPPPPARTAGAEAVRSPVRLARASERDPNQLPNTLARTVPEPARSPDTPPPAPASPVTAPVVSSPADPVDEPGVLADTDSDQPSQGPGADGGTGTGLGTGMGEGVGSGVGEGSIAGTGGGPYRPGSGITPPALEREVRPLYTEEGRRRGIEGDVLLEVVVRADGAVGTIRIVRGLGAGLDAQAVEAVRQWRFSPARRFGTPVDVLVEVAVEFRLR